MNKCAWCRIGTVSWYPDGFDCQSVCHYPQCCDNEECRRLSKETGESFSDWQFRMYNASGAKVSEDHIASVFECAVDLYRRDLAAEVGPQSDRTDAN